MIIHGNTIYRRVEAMTKKKKSDLPILFKAINKNDFSFYDTFKEDFNSWVSMRWASSNTNNNIHSLIFTNELVNKNFTACKEHDQLQWMSIALVGDGKYGQYKWIPPYKKKKGSTKNQKYFSKVKTVYPSWKDCEVEVFIKINTEDEIKDLIEQHGESDI